jgi:hypothetical protein
MIPTIKIIIPTDTLEVTISPHTGSEQVSVRALAQKDRSTIDVGRFFARLSFPAREKVKDLLLD